MTVRRAPLALVIVLAFALALPMPSAGAQSAPVVIAGRVEFATGAPVANIPVELYIVLGAAPPEQVATATDEAGRFRFEVEPAGADERYLVAVTYRDVPYVSDELTEGKADLVLRVYEPTADLRVVRLERLAMLGTIDQAGQSLLFIETVALANDSDRTYLPDLSAASGGMPTNLLRFSLPTGAVDLAPIGGIAPDEIIEVDRGFAALTPVRPGRQDFAVSYRVPYRTSGVNLTRVLPMATGDVRLLVPEGLTAVSSRELATLAPLERLGKRYLQLGGENFPAGSQVTISFGELRGSSAPLAPLSGEYDAGTLQVGAVLLAATGLAGLMLYVNRRQGSKGSLAKVGAAQPSAGAARPRGDTALEAERRELLTELAQLEDAHQAGQISREEYETTNAEIREELVEVLRQLRARDLA